MALGDFAFSSLILYGMAMRHSLPFFCPASLWLYMLTFLLCYLFDYQHIISCLHLMTPLYTLKTEAHDILLMLVVIEKCRPGYN